MMTIFNIYQGLKICLFLAIFSLMSLTKSNFLGGGAVPDDQFGNFEKPSYSGGKGGCYEVGTVPLELNGI